MASLGDIGLTHRHATTSAYSLIPVGDRIHSLSDAAAFVPISLKVAFAAPNTRSKPSTPFTVIVEDANPGENYVISRNGVPADIPHRAEPSGELKFYDLDNGVHVVSSTASASAYRITVSGTSYTIEVLSGGGSVTVADNMYGGVA